MERTEEKREGSSLALFIPFPLSLPLRVAASPPHAPKVARTIQEAHLTINAANQHL